MSHVKKINVCRRNRDNIYIATILLYFARLSGCLRFAFLQLSSGMIKRWKRRLGKDDEIAWPCETRRCTICMYIFAYTRIISTSIRGYDVSLAGYTKTRKKRIPRAFRGEATSVFLRFFLRNGSGFYSVRIECECATRAYAMHALLFLFTSASIQNRRWWTIVRLPLISRR